MGRSDPSGYLCERTDPTPGDASQSSLSGNLGS